MNVFLVFQYFDKEHFLFQGVFTTKEKAIKACRANNYCICPAVLNEERPPEIEGWDDAWYPYLENEKQQTLSL